jgi:hypothetical protein
LAPEHYAGGSGVLRAIQASIANRSCIAAQAPGTGLSLYGPFSTHAENAQTHEIPPRSANPANLPRDGRFAGFGAPIQEPRCRFPETMISWALGAEETVKQKSEQLGDDTAARWAVQKQMDL